MKFYRVHYFTEGGNSAGFSYHTSRREAEKAKLDAINDDPSEYEHPESYPKITEIEVTPTKAGILAALNRFASHNNNG